MATAEDAALLEVNSLRETWCRLETEPWGSTSQRRHFRAHLQTSPALLEALTGRAQRLWAAGRPRPPPGRLLERRHFGESCKVPHCTWRWTKQQEHTICWTIFLFLLLYPSRWVASGVRGLSSSKKHTPTPHIYTDNTDTHSNTRHWQRKHTLLGSRRCNFLVLSEKHFSETYVNTH